jgi:hypothetical protein
MRTPIAIVLGILVGVLAFAAARVALVAPEQPPHYHANFAIFMDGERVDLSGDRYMEEVSACRVSEGKILPQERAHLHNNVPDVAHVHHPGVTWGHLLANLGFGVGERYLSARGDELYVAGGGKTLKFILNGRPELSVRNRLIGSGDRLLISFGPESEAEVLRTQFPKVASSAEEFNRKPDPAGCSGAHELTLWERLRHAFAG